MAIHREIKFAGIDDLMLDPTNLRLGCHNVGRNVPQGRVLELMQDWALEELAVSPAARSSTPKTDF